MRKLQKAVRLPLWVAALVFVSGIRVWREVQVAKFRLGHKGL